MTRSPLLALGLLLSACAPITEPLGLRDPFALHRPFEGEGDQTAVRQVLGERPLAIGAIEGMTDSERAALIADILTEADARDVLMTTTDAPAGKTIRGRVVARTNDPAERQIVMAWDLPSEEGKQPRVIELTATWTDNPLDAANIPAHARRAMARELVGRLTEAPATASAEADPALTLYIAPIPDAPGDGAASLDAAMRGLLASELGAVVLRDRSPQSLTIEPAVSVTPVPERPDRERVALAWRVVQPDGTLLGTIDQSNDIPKGLLNGAWGPIALDIAAGAVAGVGDLLAQSGATRNP